MPDDYHVDFEVFSGADLKKVGAYRYAEDPTTEVLMMAIARGDEGPYLWVAPCARDALASDPRAEMLIARMDAESDALVYAHNAQFERAVAMYADTPINFMRERPDQWRCTAAMARRAALPDSLDKATQALALAEGKDARGKALIRKFCIVQTAGRRKGFRIMPADDPDAFADFGAYCLQDIVAERALHRKLADFELRGPAVLDTFLLDRHLNDRGIPVNVPALQNAQRIVEDLHGRMALEFRALTGLDVGQREAVRGWLAAQGCALENMQAETLEAAMGEPAVPEIAYTVMKLYAELSFAAVKKISAMLASANTDGRIRGMLLYHGAGTGRWSGRGIQPQNFRKPTIKHLGGAFEMIERGCDADDLDLVYGPPLEVLASCIRNFITAGIDADYNAIEARGLAWLAGQTDALERFKRNEDSYKVMAGVIYNCPQTEIPDESQERQLGKQAVLGCGYQMGASKFLKTCHSYGLTFVDRELSERAVSAYRASHGKIVQFWWDCERAALRAVAQPGRAFTVGLHVRFQVRTVRAGKFLFVRLPSGREVAYPRPLIEMDPNFGKEGVTYWGQLPGKQLWGRIRMYGGKWAENITQAVCADIMAHGGATAIRGGVDLFLFVHDQALGARPAKIGVPEFSAMMGDLPAWASGFPLLAKGKLCSYYAK